MNIDLFDDRYIYLLCPNGIEYIWEVYMHLDMNDDDAIEPNNKKIVLSVLKKLMSYGVVIVDQWFQKPELNNLSLSIDDTIKYINEIWHENSKYPDLYNMVLFASSDWYVNKTKELGFTETTDWKTFVKKNIGDLESWIEDNRPKNH